jgi:hypothetical protein
MVLKIKEKESNKNIYTNKYTNNFSRLRRHLFPESPPRAVDGRAQAQLQNYVHSCWVHLENAGRSWTIVERIIFSQRNGTMDRIERWKLADELNVYQISLLIAGFDPSEFETDGYADWPQEVKTEISPYVHAIKNAARSQKFRFKEVTNGSYNDTEIDWYDSLVNIDSFCEWLRSRNFTDGFFLPHFLPNKGGDRLLDDASGFYAPKLAAAVRAWNEVTSSPEASNGKTPKKALEIWLRKHANEYGLTNKDGNPNELGIEEICKVANWKPGGGASPTPTAALPPGEGADEGRKVRARPTTPSKSKSLRGRLSAQLDDDIPF